MTYNYCNIYMLCLLTWLAACSIAQLWPGCHCTLWQLRVLQRELPAWNARWLVWNNVFGYTWLGSLFADPALVHFFFKSKPDWSALTCLILYILIYIVHYECGAGHAEFCCASGPLELATGCFKSRPVWVRLQQPRCLPGQRTCSPRITYLYI